MAELYPEMAEILTDPELGCVYKDFLLAYHEGGIEGARSLASERGILTPDKLGIQVTLMLDTEDHEPLVAQLEAAGVQVVSASRDRVNIAVPVALVETQLQSAQPGGIFAQLTELQHVIGVRLPTRRGVDQAGVEGEGLGVIGTEAWHQAGFRGEGLRIGVLDLGFSGYEDLLGVELPESVPLETFGWYDDAEVHGAACAEIIHEVAPAAELVFAWYDGSDAAFGEAIDWLLAQNVSIISHSAGGVVSPRDGSGWDAQLVNELGAQGILWVNAAGNEADAHYRATFTDQDGDTLHDFDGQGARLPLYNYGNYFEVYLTWDDDWTYPTQDYELFLVNAEGETLASSEEAQSGGEGQSPAEGVWIETDESIVYVMVQAYEVDRPAVFDIFIQGPVELDNPSPSYSVNSPGDAVGSLTVGAVDWDNDTLAYYSSQGPTLDGRLKPEISAPTGVSGVTYGRRGFDGTSAATPHVAGAAALIWQAHPEFTRQELFDYLLSISKDLGPSGPDTGYGYGRLQLPAPPEFDPGSVEPPVVSQPPDVGDPAPLPLPTPTPVLFTTPEVTPAPGPDSGGTGSGGDILGLTLLGLTTLLFGFCGLILFVIAGFLLLRFYRAQKRVPQQVRPRPVSPPRIVRPEVQEAPTSSPVHHKADLPEVKPVICPSCGAEARPGAQFCAVCGAALHDAQGRPVDRKVGTSSHQNNPAKPRYCRYCGAALREDSRFCPECGKQIVEEA